jgi:hypothetical protein
VRATALTAGSVNLSRTTRSSIRWLWPLDTTSVNFLAASGEAPRGFSGAPSLDTRSALMRQGAASPRRGISAQGGSLGRDAVVPGRDAGASSSPSEGGELGDARVSAPWVANGERDGVAADA